MSHESRYGEGYRVLQLRALLDALQLAVYDKEAGTYEVGMSPEIRGALLAFVREELAKASASSETGEHICPKCGLRVEPHRCGGEDAAF